MACQFDPIWMTLQGSQPKRRSGVVASADLLPLDASVIPESCAPQLRAAKKSPTVQLGADVMSKRELDQRDSLGSGDATKKAEHVAEALDDPRNVISFAAVASAFLAGRPVAQCATRSSQVVPHSKRQ